MPFPLSLQNLTSYSMDLEQHPTPPLPSPDKGRDMNIHKIFGRRPDCLLNVLCTFNFCTVSRGILSESFEYHFQNGPLPLLAIFKIVPPFLHNFANGSST